MPCAEIGSLMANYYVYEHNVNFGLELYNMNMYVWSNTLQCARACIT